MTARTACPVCGDLHESVHGLSEYSGCPSCGVLYRKCFQPVNTDDGWDKSYYSDERVMSYYLRRYSAFCKIVQMMNRIVPQRGKWLDVGCGVGVLLQVAHDQRWDVYGIDPSRLCVEAAQKRMPYAHMIHGSMGDHLAEFGGFGVVSLHEVLRTMEEPGRILAGLRNVLAEGGWLFVREANADSQRTIPGRDLAGAAKTCSAWLQLWTPRSLENALRLGGFRNVHSVPSPVFTETTTGERDERGWLKRKIEVMMKRGAWPVSRMIHALSGGRTYVGPNFITLGQK